MPVAVKKMGNKEENLRQVQRINVPNLYYNFMILISLHVLIHHKKLPVYTALMHTHIVYNREMNGNASSTNFSSNFVFPYPHAVTLLHVR